MLHTKLSKSIFTRIKKIELINQIVGVSQNFEKHLLNNLLSRQGIKFGFFDIPIYRHKKSNNFTRIE